MVLAEVYDRQMSLQLVLVDERVSAEKANCSLRSLHDSGVQRLNLARVLRSNVEEQPLGFHTEGFLGLEALLDFVDEALVRVVSRWQVSVRVACVQLERKVKCIQHGMGTVTGRGRAITL